MKAGKMFLKKLRTKEFSTILMAQKMICKKMYLEGLTRLKTKRYRTLPFETVQDFLIKLDIKPLNASSGNKYFFQ